MKPRPCDEHEANDATHEMTVYERPSLIAVWRAFVCGECYDKILSLIKRGDGKHLVLIMKMKGKVST